MKFSNKSCSSVKSFNQSQCLRVVRTKCVYPGENFPQTNRSFKCEPVVSGVPQSLFKNSDYC